MICLVNNYIVRSYRDVSVVADISSRKTGKHKVYIVMY